VYLSNGGDFQTSRREKRRLSVSLSKFGFLFNPKRKPDVLRAMMPEILHRENEERDVAKFGKFAEYLLAQLLDPDSR